MKRHHAAGLSLTLLFVCGVQLPGAASPAVASADEIYDRARQTVAARSVPPFIAYTESTTFVSHGKARAQHERIILRTADGKVNVTRLPDSPADRVDTTPAIKDRPLVYPTTTFGLVRRRTGEVSSAYEPPTPESSPAVAGPAIIGHVRSTTRDYDPTFVGTESLNGASVYHLRLVPRGDPVHRPIRDLYVDTTTFDPRRISIAIAAHAGPISSRPTVNVDFAPVEGIWLIAHATMDFVLRLAFFQYAGSADYRTSDISFPAGEPTWMFDATLLAEHLKSMPR